MASRANGIVVVEAPAKLTVSLRVTGVRPDGYHLLDAEMVSLTLADTLTIDPEGDGLTHTGTYTDLPTGPSNLINKALAVAGRTAGVTAEKRIPPGGGLGGGSADAGAILRWAGVDDLARAAELGADVPFCIHGGRARVQGIGEILEPLPFAERSFTLVLPPFGCNTAEVFRAWDDLGGPTGTGENDLEPAAFLVEPRLAAWRDRLGDATGLTPQLAGSGSTLFVPGAFPGANHVVVTTRPALR